MVHSEKPLWWYELRDLLRREFIRCMREQRTFPQERRDLLDRVEDIVAQWEGIQRERSRCMGMRDALTPDTPGSAQ